MMKHRKLFLTGFCGLLLGVFLLISPGSSLAKEVLKYSCSDQVYQAYENRRLNAFTEKTGIEVDLSVSSSRKAFIRLMNGDSDMASMASRLYPRDRKVGFVETLFCRDPLGIIVNAQCPIDDLNEAQLLSIFEGGITNWKEVGGPDRPIVVIIPGEDTAAYKNFRHSVMSNREIVFGIMSARSSMIVEAARRFPWSISFIAQAAAKDNLKGVKICTLNGIAPGDKEYPFHQVFSFVTKGKPTGAVKKFIDFAFSEEGKKICIERGCVNLGDEKANL
jgi:phosphate transport system substrate-binding protein